MRIMWEMLGVEVKFHMAYRPQSSGQVERANQTIVSMLRKYVSSNGKDWDVKLPLVLMAIRATPSTRLKAEAMINTSHKVYIDRS